MSLQRAAFIMNLCQRGGLGQRSLLEKVRYMCDGINKIICNYVSELMCVYFCVFLAVQS